MTHRVLDSNPALRRPTVLAYSRLPTSWYVDEAA